MVSAETLTGIEGDQLRPPVVKEVFILSQYSNMKSIFFFTFVKESIQPMKRYSIISGITAKSYLLVLPAKYTLPDGYY